MSLLFNEKKLISIKNSTKKNFLILNDQKKIIGNLVPIRTSQLNNVGLIDTILEWRKKFNRLFPTRKLINRKTTYNFIKQSYIDELNSILFLIYTKNRELIGHVGLMKLDQESFELVNLIRGAKGGDRKLIYFAEITALNFGFNVGIKSGCFVELMSYNWMVKDLHESIGFIKKTSYPLKKIVVPDSTIHERVNENDKNVQYTIDKYFMARKKFFSLNKMQKLSKLIY